MRLKVTPVFYVQFTQGNCYGKTIREVVFVGPQQIRQIKSACQDFRVSFCKIHVDGQFGRVNSNIYLYFWFAVTHICAEWTLCQCPVLMSSKKHTERETSNLTQFNWWKKKCKLELLLDQFQRQVNPNLLTAREYDFPGFLILGCFPTRGPG